MNGLWLREPRPKAAICELMAKWGGALKMQVTKVNLTTLNCCSEGLHTS